jgi:tetratricopeptide (TPR) repeat protein
MDNILSSILSHLDAEEIADFRAHLIKKGREKLEFLLFELMTQQEILTSTEIMRILYQPDNRNAYNSLRKRLIQELNSFVVQQRMAPDSSDSSCIYSLISMARYMLGKNAYSSARHFLNKAERLAENFRDFELLEHIYNIQMNHADLLGLRVKDVKIKHKANRMSYDALHEIKNLHASLKEETAQAKRAGIVINTDEATERILSQLENIHPDTNNPAIVHELVAFLRSSIVSGKGYVVFEKTVVSVYNGLVTSGAFGKNDHGYQMSFLMMIAHAQYRNCHFKEAHQWLQLLAQKMKEHPHLAHPHFVRFAALQAAVCSYSGENVEAIKIVQDALRHKKRFLEVHEWLNMQLNLSVYYFQAEDYKKAKETMRQLGPDDNWLEEKLGTEWRLKKNMIEMIVLYEQGKDELSENMLKRILHYYADFLNQPAHAHTLSFLELVGEMFAYPERVTEDDFREKVKKCQALWSGPKNDIQAITFFCWLKSKMKKVRYYPLLVETLSKLAGI